MKRRSTIIIGGWLTLAASVNFAHAQETGSLNPRQIAQQAYLKASNTESDDNFGGAVAVSGDIAVVGARYEDSDASGVNSPTGQTNNSAVNSGAAYVFSRTATNWSQQAYLKPSNTAPESRFGWSLAVSVDTIVVGAPGSEGLLGDPGSAYVFVRSGTNWTQQACLKASNPGMRDGFGISVSVSGDTVVVGAWKEASSATGINGNQNDDSAPYSGAAYVFVRNGTNWIQQAYLKASNAGGLFGWSVAVSDETVVVGAPIEGSAATGVNGEQNDNSHPEAGAAYVFIRSETNWTQQAYLKASNSGAGDRFGSSVAISGETIAVGAPQESSDVTGMKTNTARYAGAAYIFARMGTNWTQQAYLKASNAGALDIFGNSITISSNTVVVGASGESSNATGVNGNQMDNSADASGASYVFVRTETNWVQEAYLKASNTGTLDGFGSSVAATASAIIVGATAERSSATGVNGDQSNDSAPSAGAAYIFANVASAWPRLEIAQSSNGVSVSWPLPASDYVLEAIQVLDTPTMFSWTPIPLPYQTNTTRIFVTIPTPSTSSFYRLSKP